MTERRHDAAGLARLERKIDRLTRLVIFVAVAQPLLLIGQVMPGTATQILTVSLLVLLVALAAFPNLEVRLPVLMRQAGRIYGQLLRRLRAPRSTARKNSPQDTAA